MTKFKHDILVRIVRTLDAIMITVPFMMCWFLYYAPRISSPYYSKGNFLVVALYFILYIVFARLYEGMRMSVYRVSEIVYGQFLAAGVSDAIIYVVIWLLSKHLPNIMPGVAALAGQILMAFIWAFFAQRWYFHTFPPQKMAIIYDLRKGMKHLIDEYGLNKKYDVQKIIQVKACLDDLSILENVETVLLSGIHSHDRNIILKYCIANDKNVLVIPRVGDVIMSGARTMHMFHIPMLQVGRYMAQPEYLFIKRLADIVISAIALVILSPIILVTAIAIKADDGGPVFYKQVRLTQNGKEFKIIKFRSMRIDAEKDGVARLSTGEKDDRITKVGKIIRRFRIDELPQLINILEGDLSICGPRPERPEIAEKYCKKMPEFSLRLQAKAGLTGYAQVYGKYNTTPYDKLQMDLMYIAHPSVFEDLKIMLATIKILFMAESTEGIEEGETSAMSEKEKREDMLNINAAEEQHKVVNDAVVADDSIKYTVVIPLYNKGEHIVNALKSVLNQTYRNFEIIVVDDGSTDDSLQWARSVVSDKVHLYTQKNEGVSVARNVGIENAKGTYISFLDADDVWHPEYLQTIDQLTQKYPCSDIFVTAYEVLMGDGKVNLSSQLTPDEGCLESYWATLDNKYDFVWTSATTVKKQALQKAGMFRPGEKIGQDLDMWARVARINPHVAYSAKVCVSYTRNAKENARSRVRIAWAGAFIKDLEEEMEKGTHSARELTAIQKKYDMKMTVYIFTSIMAGEKERAIQALRAWQGEKNRRNMIFRTGLKIAYCMPNWLNQTLYKVRLKIF